MRNVYISTLRTCNPGNKPQAELEEEDKATSWNSVHTLLEAIQVVNTKLLVNFVVYF
jgi:hypothetical protein